MSNIVPPQSPFADLPDLQLMTGGAGQLAVPETFLPIGCPEKFKHARSSSDVYDNINIVRKEMRRWEGSIAVLVDGGTMFNLARACNVMLDRVQQQVTDDNFAEIDRRLRNVLLPLRPATGWRVTSMDELQDVEGVASRCLLNLAELVSDCGSDAFSVEELHQVTTYTRMAKSAVAHHNSMGVVAQVAGLVPEAS